MADKTKLKNKTNKRWPTKHYTENSRPNDTKPTKTRRNSGDLPT